MIIVNVCVLQMFFCGLFCASDYSTKKNVFSNVFFSVFGESSKMNDSYNKKINDFCNKKIRFVFADSEKILKSLPEYEKAKSEFEKFVEDKQKELGAKEEALNRYAGEIENKFNAAKEQIRKKQLERNKKIHESEKSKGMSENKEESLVFNDTEEGEFKKAEEDYKANMENLKRSYSELVNEQKKVEDEIQKKRSELFLPLDVMVRQYTSEFAVFLGNQMSEELSTLKKKEVNVYYIVLDKKCVAETYYRIKNKISGLDVTEMIENYINNIRKIKSGVGEDKKNNVVLSEKLKNKKNRT